MGTFNSWPFNNQHLAGCQPGARVMWGPTLLARGVKVAREVVQAEPVACRIFLHSKPVLQLLPAATT